MSCQKLKPEKNNLKQFMSVKIELSVTKIQNSFLAEAATGDVL